jgi:hypothetical protein
MMKANMLGLLLVSALSTVQPAAASSFTYDVNFAITSQVPDEVVTFTGTIVTDCNSCELFRRCHFLVLYRKRWTEY